MEKSEKFGVSMTRHTLQPLQSMFKLTSPTQTNDDTSQNMVPKPSAVSPLLFNKNYVMGLQLENLLPVTFESCSVAIRLRTMFRRYVNCLSKQMALNVTSSKLRGFPGLK